MNNTERKMNDGLGETSHPFHDSQTPGGKGKDTQPTPKQTPPIPKPPSSEPKP